MNIRTLLSRLPGEPVLLTYLFSPLVSAWRILGLGLMARWEGGRFRRQGRLKVKCGVVFQGRGEVVTAEGVTLGYRMAGGPRAPILLQPREPEARIEIGEGTSIMNGCELIARSLIRIGKGARIGPHTLIYDSDFHGLGPQERDEPGETRAVCLEENVWVGSRALILKGVTVGRDAVIAAGSVVTKDVPAGAIAAGNPARVVGSVYEKAQA